MDSPGEFLVQRAKENLGFATRSIARGDRGAENLQCRDLSLADLDMYELVIGRRQYGTLRLKIGSRAVTGYGFHKLPYDLTGSDRYIVEPGEEHELLFTRRSRVDTSKGPERLYGFMRYFDLATIGGTLEEGGELDLVTPDSSSNG